MLSRITVLFTVVGWAFPNVLAAAPPLEKIRLPAGFEISVYAGEVPGARSLTRSAGGVVYVGTQSPQRNQRESVVYAVVDRDGDSIAEQTLIVASGLFMANGVAWRDGDLYVAEVNRLLRLRDIDEHLQSPPSPEVLYDRLPDNRWHGWKFIAFGPDGRLYLQVGAPCNVCEPDEPFSTILRFAADFQSYEVFARGVRQTVGFDWDPRDGALWFTDNGRDMLGDDLPPDELNRAPSAGLHFGFPYCHAGELLDPDLGDGRSCGDYRPPAIKLGAHVAAIGMRFYRGDSFPTKYKNRIFIAEHGSWNRSKKSGYRVTTVEVDAGGQASNYSVFAEGWLDPATNNSWGRPADLLELPDGSLLVSDEQQGVVYRIAYSGD